jgi:hypothetical protein
LNEVFILVDYVEPIQIILSTNVHWVIKHTRSVYFTVFTHCLTSHWKRRVQQIYKFLRYLVGPYIKYINNVYIHTIIESISIYFQTIVKNILKLHAILINSEIQIEDITWCTILSTSYLLFCSLCWAEKNIHLLVVSLFIYLMSMGTFF